MAMDRNPRTGHPKQSQNLPDQRKKFEYENTTINITDVPIEHGSISG